MSMNCEQIESLLPEYWSGAIAVKDHKEVDRHLDECASCRAAADRLGSLWKKLDLVNVPAPSPALRDRFYETLDAFRAGVESGNKTSYVVPKPVKAHWWQQPFFQFATAAAMLVIGVLAGRSTGSLVTPATPAPDQIAQLRGEVNSMRQLVALSLLQQQSASDRMRGVSWAYRVEKSDTEVVGALLETVNGDANVNVRLSAIDALKRFGSSPVVRKALLQAIGKQESPMVQVGLIDAIVDLNDRSASGQLKQISQASNFNAEVREHAAWAVQQLGQE